jgi:2-methylfumaryl-CoA hydratase
VKANLGPFFEDFALGPLACPGARQVTAGDVAQYLTLIGDRSPRYTMSDTVHPLLVFHIVFGQTVRSVSLNARANLGYAECLWHRPVTIGATLRTKVEVIGLRETSKGTTGIVWVRTTGCDSRGPVLSFVRWVLVNKRDPLSPWGQDPVVPNLSAAVDPGQLRVGLPCSPLDTGGRWRFGDYAVGEVIKHPDRVTVTEAEPRLFTRLFLNTARVHFEAPQGLVYGGYPMCLGYAAGFDGFENRLGIAAVNSGTHTAPVHAGDTLSAQTIVLACKDLSATPAGAIRCRLEVFKNADMKVLDLDYWELITR